jgi:DNA-binding response OmpR family regulator
MRAFRVLLADPDPLLLAACRFFLVGHHVQLTGVSSGIDCQDQMGRERPDLLIVDCDLPGPPPEQWLFAPGTDQPPVILLLRPRPDRDHLLCHPGLTVLLEPVSAAQLALLIGSLAQPNDVPEDGEKSAPWGKKRQTVSP